MKKRTNIMKGAGVLLIAAIMILSAVTVTANTDTNIENELTMETGLAPVKINSDTQQQVTTGRGSTVYAVDATNANFVWFDTDTPGTYNIIAAHGFANFPQGACFVGDVYWTTDTTGEIYTVDELTGVMTYVGNAGVTDGLVALAYDPSTGILYGGSITDLYTINMGTGAATLVGSYGTIPGSGWLISLDCDNTGNMYGYNIDNTASAILFSVDTSSGAATAIGPIGFMANYGQDLAYDKDNDVLYACAYDVGMGYGASLWSIDTTTGLGTHLGALAGGAQTTTAAIPYAGEPTARIDVEKQVLVPGSWPATYQIGLEDTFGDGWNGCWINVYLNGVEVGNYTIVSGGGPEYHDIIVSGGDNITIYHHIGSWASENKFYILDAFGVKVAEAFGEDPEDPGPEIIYIVPITPPGMWADADTAEEAIDMEICSIIEFQIIITNNGDEPLFDIYLDDYWDDSLQLVDWDIEPMGVEPNYAWWWFPGPLVPGETITIHVWMHVVGPHCSIDENLAIATASYYGLKGRGERIIYSNTNSIESPDTKITTESPINYEPSEYQLNRDIIWDNGMSAERLLAAHLEPSYGELGMVADDFQFPEDTVVNDVHWVGGYWNGVPAPYDWEIRFYEDNASGLGPGALFAGPFVFTDAEIIKEDLGNQYFNMSVMLPYDVVFIIDQIYWITLQGQGTFPPQSGVGCTNQSAIIMHEMVWKSEYFGVPTWVNGSDQWTYGPMNVCFQLTYEELQDVVTDEDSVFIHAREPAHIDVEKYVGVVGEGNYILGLEDTFGDGWNDGYLDVYINGVFYDTYTIVSGGGPEYHDIPVAHGDEIFVDYTPGGWSYENIWYLIDCDGNELWRQLGSDDPDAHDMTTTADITVWFDADTEAEAVDQFICTVIPFKITIHNDGIHPLFDIYAYDTFDDSLEFVNATPYPDYVGAGELAWYGLGDLMFCETIEIIIWMHVVGEHCSNDENLGAADGWSDYIQNYVYDEDSAWIHCVAPDEIPPVTEIDITGDTGDNGWFIGDATITITATDDDSGVFETWYRIDGATWTLYTAPITNGDDGTHTVEAYSVDNAGNVEDPPVSEDFKIDQTDPTIDLTWDDENSKLVADVDDDPSGVAQVEFFVNDESIGIVTEEPYEMEYDASSGDTAHAVVTDNAGNSATSDVIDSYALSVQSNLALALKAIPIVQQKSL